MQLFLLGIMQQAQK